MKDTSKIIKLPDILVFTIERYMGETNRISIKPDEIIDVKKYVDTHIKDTNFELFAVNIRLGYDNENGHQICQIKKNNDWYILNDSNTPARSDLNEYNKNTYGLFYKKIENKDIQFENLTHIKYQGNFKYNNFKNK